MADGFTSNGVSELFAQRPEPQDAPQSDSKGGTAVSRNQQAPLEGADYERIGDPVLLDKIDKLFACNVGEYIDLPQLVVVGDQSSGKSSVLEGLTRLPFPRDSGLCTKFCTQITFRREPRQSIKVSIIPSPEDSEGEQERKREWSPPEITTLDAQTFANLMRNVHEMMGLTQRTIRSSGLQKTFSKDILRLEIHGPKEAHLSVIDVPGIFRNTTAGVTTTSDLELVRDMVNAQIENPRTVILAVVPANVDPATQEILEMAKKVDPHRQRTIGVLTKPDLVDRGAEDKIIELIQGKGSDANLDWSVVKNPGQRELNDTKYDRRALEDTFFARTAPWNTLPKERRGVDALRSRLEEVLTSHIRREFKKVRAEILKLLGSKKRALAELGAERDSADKQRNFLLNISTEFQRIADLAVKADYGGDCKFDGTQGLRLATNLVRRNEAFAEDMDKFGHQYRFKTDDDVPGTQIGRKSDKSGDGLKNISSRRTPNAPELDDILAFDDRVDSASSVDIFEWLKSTYQNGRGFELGTFDCSLLGVAMRQQAAKWEAISCGYAGDTVAIVHSFITKLLETLCLNERVSQRLLDLLLDGLLEQYSKTITQVKSFVNVELASVPMTLNHYFNDNLEKCRQNRMKSALAGKATVASGLGPVVTLDAITKSHPMSNADHTIRDIHDILRSYYKVARKRFVDNVCMYATMYALVYGPDTPLKLFSPQFVSRLSDEQLGEVAGEDPRKKKDRARLLKEIKDLEAGRKVLN